MTWKDKLPGGLADKKKPEDFSPASLREGRKVESEHTKDKHLQTEVAMDHLMEDRGYYDKLRKMEKEGMDASLLSKLKSVQSLPPKMGLKKGIGQFAARDFNAEAIPIMRERMRPLEVVADPFKAASAPMEVTLRTNGVGWDGLKSIIDKVNALGAGGHSFGLIADESTTGSAVEPVRGEKIRLGGWDGDGGARVEVKETRVLEEKKAFATSAYSGPLNPLIESQASYQPGFKPPTLAKAIQKTGSEKVALLERLVRLGATDVPGTPRLFMRQRSPEELAALQHGVAGAFQKVEEPVKRVVHGAINKVPHAGVQKVLKGGANLLIENPETIPMQAVPIPGLTPAYIAAKKGLEKGIDRLSPVPSLGAAKLAGFIRPPKQEEKKGPGLVAPAALVGLGAVTSAGVPEGVMNTLGYQPVYHGTSNEAARSIKQQGLDPAMGGAAHGASAAVADADYLKGSKGRVHVATTAGDAAPFASAAEALSDARKAGRPHLTNTEWMDIAFSGKGPKGSLLSGAMPYSDFAKNFEPDPDFSGGFRSSKPVSPEVFSTGLKDVVRNAKNNPRGVLQFAKEHPKQFARGVSKTLAPLALVAGGGAWLGHNLRRRREGEKNAFDLQGELEHQGLDIAVENRKGSVRKGVDKDGTPWRTVMKFPYGYIRGSKGADGEEVDCYVGPVKDAPNAYVVHQRKDDGKTYDEDKVMLGFGSLEEARKAYLKHYDDPKFLGPIKEVPVERLKELVESGKKLVKISAGAPTRGNFMMASDIPPFRAPRLDKAIQKEGDFVNDYINYSPGDFKQVDLLKKRASITSPAGQLARASKVGLPKPGLTPPPGEPTWKQSKPIGFGQPLPGTLKTGV